MQGSSKPPATGPRTAGDPAGDPPLVSIVVPTYNGSVFVAQAVRSALGQSFDDLEVVVADDASGDDTLDVVGGFTDRRLRVLTSEVNAGPGPTWNRGVRAARGRYVKVLCQDDVLAPTCVERQVEALAGDCGARTALVCVRRTILDDRGRVLMQRGFSRRIHGVVPGREAARLVVRSGSNPIGEPSAVLFRREDALDAGLFDEAAEYVIDLDLWLRLLALGDLHVIDEPLAAFRISSGSWSAALAGRQAQQYCDLVRRVGRDRRLDVPRRDVVMGCAKARVLSLGRRGLYALYRHRSATASRAASQTS
jgi:glycosyltransferase involved in cell wall biosynthesis